jgi:hypothetical protein
LEPERTLLNYIALIQAWQELLGYSVDVAQSDNLHEAIREQLYRLGIVGVGVRIIWDKQLEWEK